ncbi:MAG: DUF72 domain-containing protein [Acidobacteriia bacterium]|nr:DUF72 domain-containing protein [Terriglobia bacterium]MBV8905169.1 DUF72 domain-containing protein [Terriglobia bacterium]MBV9745288.1 DUF72 domain-containing protein [Terriglobia bacterium]
MATLYAGTSGFAYPAWKPAFYPAKLPSKLFLKHYSERLNCVEVNYTFRRLPAAATLESWVSQTAAGFVFAVKANQRITHILRLKNAEQATTVFLNAIDPLRTARRLGPILFQLPPQLKCDVALLRDYLALLPRGEALSPRYAFEFRHESWLADPVYTELESHNVSLCVAESERLEVPEVITADFVYYRLRKPDYTEADIDAFAARARELLATGRDLYLFFKHEETPEGALNAEMLLQRTGATEAAQ